MKVILQKDVKDLGRVGDVVSVSLGYARNFLFPRQLASVASENKVKQWEHLKTVTVAKARKAVAERKTLTEKLNGLNLSFHAQAGEDDHLFGSVSAQDISKALDEQGYHVDKKDIHLEPIKVLGQHKAEVKLGKDLTAELIITVDRAE